MARIPILKDPGQLNTGNQTQQTPNLPAVTNASLGKALGNIGEMAMDISEKAKRADDVTKLTEASMAMNRAQMEFATFQQDNPDEKQWLPKWQEMQTNLQQQFNSTELTPEARLQLNDRLSDWSTRGTINVQANAFKQTGARMNAVIRTAELNGDYPTAYQGVDDAVAANVTTKEEGDLMKARLGKSQKNINYNTYLTQKERLAAKGERTMKGLAELEGYLQTAKESMLPEQYQLEVDNLNDAKEELAVQLDTENEPEFVIKALDYKDANGNFTYAPNLESLQQREAMKNQAIARIEGLQMQEQRTVMNGILNGSIQNMKQAEAMMPRSDNVNKSKIQSIFDKKPPNQYEASILKRSLEKAVESYDPENDPSDAKMFNIIDTINRLNLYDEKLTSDLRERFYKKQQDRTPPSPLDNEIVNHKKFLDYIYEPKLKALMDEKTKEVAPKDQEEFRRILSDRDQNAMNYERMIKSGQIKTVNEAKDFSIQSLSDPYADQAMDYWRYAPSSNGKTGQLELTPEEIAQIEKQRLTK
jgi:hypothetical protein